MGQSYQEVSRVILEDLLELYKLGVTNLNKINLKEFKGDFQDYIFYKQNKTPQRYEKLVFNKNMAEPSCRDLGRILGDFMLDGCLDYERNIQIKKVEEYINSKQ